MRRFAQDTEVNVQRSREQIGYLLSEWSCEQTGWLDDHKGSRVVLQFVIPRLIPGTSNAVAYRVQFAVDLPKDSELEKAATSSRGVAEGKLAQLRERRGRREHRVLYLWIKAALEAVTEGIVPFEAIFMPFFVRDDGATIYEAAAPTMHKLLAVPVSRMLTAGANR
jgi:hypothetical protein